jgi:hypothetical protein
MEQSTQKQERQLTSEENAMSTRPMTLGEKRCHIDFNPSADDKIGKFKRMMADAIDFLNQEGYDSELKHDEAYEQERCFQIAMESLETAQMFGVKGIAKGLKK